MKIYVYFYLVQFRLTALFERINKILLAYHHIKSERIFRNAVVTIFLILAFAIVLDLVVDLKATNVELLALFAVLLGTIILLTFSIGNRSWIMFLFILTLYSLLEVHAILIPTAYHVINYYWFLVPVLGLLLLGIRSAIFWMFVCLLSIIINGYIEINQIDSEVYTSTINIKSYMAGGLLFLFASSSVVFFLYRLLSDAYSEMKDKSEALSDLKIKLELSLKSIFELSNHPALLTGDIETVYKLICQLTTETLKTSRVSIWLYNEELKKIHREYLFEKEGGTDEKVDLFEKDFPRYFKAVLGNTIIAAEDAHTHPSTAEFSNSYLTPLDIHSMLDASFYIDGKFAGVICCEHQHEKHHWTPEDLLFIKSMSDVISMAHKTHQINEFSNTVHKQNIEITAKSTEIEAINNDLEKRVAERTLVLEEKNKQLTEYAFVNSHLLRAPLSKILGLCYVLTNEQSFKIEDEQLLNALVESSQELDHIITTISNLLYDGNNFSRAEIEELIKKSVGDSSSDTSE